MIQEYSNIIEHIHAANPLAALAIGSSLLQGIGGLFQSSKAKKALKSLKDPGYNIPKEFEQNIGVAEQMSRQGMPSQEYNLATTNIQRGTQAGLRQLSRMSNPFAGISGLSRNQTDALAKLDAQNANIRRQNLLQAIGVRRELAGQKLAQQQYAQQRYMDQVNQANALRGAGMQNMFGALGNLGTIGMMGGFGGGGGIMASQMPMTSGAGVSNMGGISTPSSLPMVKL